jgi:hypothetical protein
MVNAIVVNPHSGRFEQTVQIAESDWQGDSFWVPVTHHNNNGMAARNDLWEGLAVSEYNPGYFVNRVYQQPMVQKTASTRVARSRS